MEVVNVKRMDIIILVVPFIILGIAYPFLPEQIPRQFRIDGSIAYMAKEFVFIAGFLPYIIYKSLNKRRK